MRMGQVIGTVTLSRSHPSLVGASYRVVVPLSLDNLSGRTLPDAEPLVVYDDLGTGLDDVIAFTEGGEATNPFTHKPSRSTPTTPLCSTQSNSTLKR